MWGESSETPRAIHEHALRLLREDGQKNAAAVNVYLRLAADGGCYPACCTLAMRLFFGDGCQKDVTESEKYLKIAVDLGFGRNEWYYSIDGYCGGAEMCDMNVFLKKLADSGSSTAQYLYGVNVDAGIGIERDVNVAVEYFKLSAAQNNRCGQLALALKYHSGIVVPQDRVEANRYFRMSAEQGYREAQLYYAVNLLRGDGVEVNEEEGGVYLKLAAEQGQPQAQYHYGVRLWTNDEDRNIALAVEYIRRAAAQEHKEAAAFMAKHIRIDEDGNVLVVSGKSTIQPKVQPVTQGKARGKAKR